MIEQMVRMLMMAMMSSMSRGMIQGVALQSSSTQSGSKRRRFPDTTKSASKSIDESGMRAKLNRALEII